VHFFPTVAFPPPPFLPSFFGNQKGTCLLKPAYQIVFFIFPPPPVSPWSLPGSFRNRFLLRPREPRLIFSFFSALPLTIENALPCRCGTKGDTNNSQNIFAPKKVLNPLKNPVQALGFPNSFFLGQLVLQPTFFFSFVLRRPVFTGLSGIDLFLHLYLGNPSPFY